MGDAVLEGTISEFEGMHFNIETNSGESLGMTGMYGCSTGILIETGHEEITNWLPPKGD